MPKRFKLEYTLLIYLDPEVFMVTENRHQIVILLQTFSDIAATDGYLQPQTWAPTRGRQGGRGKCNPLEFEIECGYYLPT